MEIKNYLSTLTWVKLAAILFIFTLATFILHVGYILFVPLFAGLLIAMLLYPLARFFEKLRVGTKLAALFSVLLFILSVAMVGFIIIKEVVQFSDDLPGAEEKMAAYLQHAVNKISFGLYFTGEQNKVFFNRALKSMVGPLLMSSARTLVSTILLLFLTFFILVHRSILMRFLLSLLNAPAKQKITGIIQSTRLMINSYLWGLLSQMAIVFSLLLIALLIMGIKYALLLALIAAVFNIIPYLGIYVAAAFAVLITMVYGGESKSTEALIIFLAVHFLDANVVVPFILGHRVKMNPLMAFIALITGELIWGVPGLFLFIPLTAVLRIIFKNIRDLAPLSILLSEEKTKANELS